MKNITILFLVGLVSFSSGFSLAPKSSTSSRNLSSRLSLSTKTKTKDSSTAKNEKVAENYATDPSNIQKRVESSSGFSYVEFAKENPFANNLMIATTKTAAADLLAQTVIAQTPLTEVDLQRSFLFCLFGCIYLGAFQYLYQVQVSGEFEHAFRDLCFCFVFFLCGGADNRKFSKFVLTVLFFDRYSRSFSMWTNLRHKACLKSFKIFQDSRPWGLRLASI